MFDQARGVAGDEALAAEFLENDPALPPSARHQPGQAPGSRGDEGPHRGRGVRAGELDRNVKRGRAASGD